MLIADIPNIVGIEILVNNRKITEVFRAENKEGPMEGMYQVHCIKDWSCTEILNAKQLQSLVVSVLSIHNNCIHRTK
jgi:hypothetical protein